MSDEDKTEKAIRSWVELWERDMRPCYDEAAKRTGLSRMEIFMIVLMLDVRQLRDLYAQMVKLQEGLAPLQKKLLEDVSKEMAEEDWKAGDPPPGYEGPSA